MSRHFARVGVDISPVRLQRMTAGAAAPDEWTDVEFALLATRAQREKRRAKFQRRKRLGIQWLVAAALVLAALNLLACTVYILVSVLTHESPL